MAGKSPAPERRVEVLVIGAGPAGVAAAIEAAAGGAQVLLVDENPAPASLMGLDVPHYYGGRQTGAGHVRARLIEQVFKANPALETAFEAGVDIELGVCCWGAWVPGYGLAALPGPLAGLADEMRAWMVGFDRLILATGARDVAFAFPGWDQPGVMGARALQALIDTYDAFAGRRLAILGAGDLARQTAALALDRGLEVVALIDIAGGAPGLAAGLAPGVEILTGHVPVAASGGVDGVERLTVRDLVTGDERTLTCDTVVQAISLTPVIDLLDVLGARLAMQPTLGGHVPVSPDGAATSLAEVFIAGDVAGAPGGGGVSRKAAEASGRRAGRLVLASLGRAVRGDEPPAPTDAAADAVALQQAWTRVLMASTEDSVILCQCEAVSRASLLGVRPPDYLGPPSASMAARDLGRLLEDGAASPDQIKRLTRAGMGPCQGRRCREQVALTLACAAGRPAAAIALAGYRPPVRPLPLSVLAAWDEDPIMARHWDVWFGIKGQWTPYADIGGEREALYDGLFGGESPL